jgi:diacylglycerol kinase (ATP)
MKTVVVVNPSAGNGIVGRKWATYNRSIVSIFGSSKILMTAAPGEATILVRSAIHSGVERIVVVGGDGSVNEAVNGFFENDKPIGSEVSLAVYPIGTGTDFARTIGLSGVSLTSSFLHATEHRVDVGKASFINHDGRSESRYFLNISSFGSSGLVVDKVNSTSKRLGAKLSFFIGTVRGLLDYQNQRVRIRVDDIIDEEMEINTVAVANGRYFGGGMMIAPNALLGDGFFDIIVVGNIGVMTFLRNAPLLYQGRHLGLPNIRSFRGRVIEVMPLGDLPVLLEFDGEQAGQLPVRYEILPQALRLFAPAQANSN